MTKFVTPVRLLSILLACTLLVSTASVNGLTYSPGVSARQWAKYAVPYYSCQSTDPTYCQTNSPFNLANTDYGLLQVVGVSGTSVTLRLLSTYRNGSIASKGILADVSAGTLNVSATSPFGPLDYFVLTQGLEYPDSIWSSPSSPTINATRTQDLLGQSRVVNFLNTSLSLSYGLDSISTKVDVAWDKASGIFVGISFFYSIAGAGPHTQISFAINMVDNNIWLTSSPPDFSLGSSPTSLNIPESQSGTSAVTVTPLNGYSSITNLEVSINPSGLTCSFNSNTLHGGGSVTLTCSGRPGTYSVTVKASGGGNSHSTLTTVTVGSAPPSSQPASPLNTPFIAGGSIAAIVVLAFTLLLIRRRPKTSRTTSVSPVKCKLSLVKWRFRTEIVGHI